MAEEYPYQKKRTDFGRHATFEDTETRIVGAVAFSDAKDTEYTPRDPNKVVLHNIPDMSEHRVNTERVPTENNGMHHSVGGWPKEYDY
jgi:hypothetical protein